MKKYFLVSKLALSDILEYRFDFFIQTFKYAIAVIMMALVWIAVSKENPATNFSAEAAVRYYLFAAILYSLSNFHTRYIELDIIDGGLTKHILKPISPFLYYLFYQTSASGFEMLLKAVVLPTVFFLFGTPLTASLPNLLFFFLYLPFIYFFSACLLMSISFLSFWFKEIYAIRYTALITFRMMSGILIPISFFPNWFQHVSQFLPFQYLAFVPIQVVQGNLTPSLAIRGLVILGLWSMIMLGVNRMIWIRGVRSYEGGGI